MAKLGASDLHAMDADYHTNCLVSLYNRARRKRKEETNTHFRMSCETTALAELVSYIEESQVNEEVAPVFKLSSLCKLYSSRLQQLGVEQETKINSTRMKEKLLKYIPELESYHEGRDVFLAFGKDIGGALKKACFYDQEADAIQLVRASHIIRKAIFEHSTIFAGSFDEGCQTQSVPQELQFLMQLILEGPKVSPQSNAQDDCTQAALTVSQMIVFNAKSTRAKSDGMYHTAKREPPLPLYLGFLLHAQTCKRNLIDRFYKLGLCASYDRILQLTTEMANSLCSLFLSQDLVCPPKLQPSLFTTGGVDNIDHNTSSTWTNESFHGTAMSVVQHPIDKVNHVSIPLPENKAGNKKSILPLPSSYTDIQPVTSISMKDLSIPTAGENINLQALPLKIHDTARDNWLTKVETMNKSEDISGDENLTWAAFHASQQVAISKQPCLITLLPLFTENAHSVAMILHAMNSIKAITAHLNPVQVSVLTMDQPLFALGKQIQWKFKDALGEDKYVLLMGALHIEMAVLRMIGIWLQESGWLSALVQADIVTSGRAEGIEHGSHVARARYLHQVFAICLHILQKEAYTTCQEDTTNLISFEHWKQIQCEKHPQFKY